ncbi:MAG: hypothetical protein K2H22_05915 [Muribaculaceae bacterium]|nr:hypothetical protein [Muribaculaceae bacterium]
MKRLLLCAIIAMSGISAMADLEGDGYYRVQNAITKRYAYLLDNKGSINIGTTSADVQAIELYLGFAKASSDPSTVFYIDKINDSSSKYEYNIAGQGTNLHAFLDIYMKIIDGKEIDGQQAYYASGTYSGGTKYLGDLNSSLREEQGFASVDVSGDRRLWYIHAVKADSDESYFGVAPVLTVGGKYYNPMFASFPYDAYSEGIKFYTITRINPWAEVPAVALKELTGVVPAGTPVIIECANPLPADNRLNVGSSGALADPAGNMLKGVYFKNDDVIHKNLTPYDKRTMRILTVKNGQLVFDVADIDYLPRNQAYLQLSGDEQCAVECYRVVTEDVYEAEYSSVEALPVSAVVDAYTLDGRLVKAGISRQEASSLGKGLYILRSGAVSEKLIVR